MSLNDSLIMSYERQIISKLNIDIDLFNENYNEIFISLLNSNNGARTIIVYFLNKLLPNITNFNDICVKYFQYLIDSYKIQINKKQINSVSLISTINALSGFIKIFSKNQEKYNEKHKNIIKQFPQFIQLLFKLFQQKYNNFDKKVIESFLLLILSFIEFYPTLVRNYQNILEKIIKNIFLDHIMNNISNDNTIEIASVIYTNLYKLSPNINNKLNEYIKNIIDNIKFYLEFFLPKTINEEGNEKSITIEEKNNLFSEEKIEFKINDKNLIHANKVMNILFNLLTNMFNYMVNNIYLEIDLQSVFSLFNEILISFENLYNNKSLSTIIFNGLSKYNYELFLIKISENIFDLLIYLISNFSRYIYCYNIFFSKLINRLLLNQYYYKYFSLHEKIISFFSTIILYYNDILPDKIEIIIYKHLYDNLPLLYLNYLQAKDKTVLEVNDVYFKASNIKNQIYNKNDENRILLIKYFELLYHYCEVNQKIWKLSNKNILGGIIDLIVLPPFAKYIFNIEDEIKKIIINILEICIIKNLVVINLTKLYNFLTNFYLFDGSMKYKAESLIYLIRIKDVELNNEINNDVNNDITGQILNFNKKIKEYLNEANKKFENIKYENIQIHDNINLDNIKIEEEQIKEKVINNEDKEMLNKKRKIKKEYEVKMESKDITERKGNKKKNDNLNKKKKKESTEKININELKNEENNEKIDENENIQIDEDIEIPDII